MIQKKYLFCSIIMLCLIGCGQSGPLYLPKDDDDKMKDRREFSKKELEEEIILTE